MITNRGYSSNFYKANNSYNEKAVNELDYIDSHIITNKCNSVGFVNNRLTLENSINLSKVEKKEISKDSGVLQSALSLISLNEELTNQKNNQPKEKIKNGFNPNSTNNITTIKGKFINYL